MVQSSQCYPLFFLCPTGKQQYFNKAYLLPCLRTAVFILYSHRMLKQTLFLSHQYLQASKLIELKAQSMPLMANSAGSCTILASGQKHQCKRNCCRLRVYLVQPEQAFWRRGWDEITDVGIQAAALVGLLHPKGNNMSFYRGQ